MAKKWSDIRTRNHQIWIELDRYSSKISENFQEISNNKMILWRGLFDISITDDRLSYIRLNITNEISKKSEKLKNLITFKELIFLNLSKK